MEKTTISKRLATLGYIVTSNDDWLIDFLIRKIESDIKAECNLIDIPLQLDEVVADMVCGHFLSELHTQGKLDGFDYGAAIKQIKEGDTTVEFENNKSGITSLIGSLINRGGEIWSHYRKIKW